MFSRNLCDENWQSIGRSKSNAFLSDCVALTLSERKMLIVASSRRMNKERIRVTGPPRPVERSSRLKNIRRWQGSDRIILHKNSQIKYGGAFIEYSAFELYRIKIILYDGVRKLNLFIVFYRTRLRTVDRMGPRTKVHSYNGIEYNTLTLYQFHPCTRRYRIVRHEANWFIHEE